MCMNVLYEEQDNFVIERSGESVVPVAAFENIILHHEFFELIKLKDIIEMVGGEVLSEGYYV